jgi:hypothetical protein
MAYTLLAPVVKAVRLRYAVPFVLLLVGVYWLGIRPWMANWGATPAEQQRPLPGDELRPAGARPPAGGRASTLALTIDAPPEAIWPWLVQVGQDRGGFYSYTWLENLLGADIHNADTLHGEWQQLAVGDAWRLAPPAYLGGIGKAAAVPVVISEPPRTLVLEMFGAHVIEPIDAHSSRLIVRGQAGAADLLSAMIVDPLVFTMERRMLLGLKARAEGRPDAPPLLMAVAHVGWIAAGIAVAALFLTQRARRLWLLLPAAAALPALLGGHDPQAALAAFLAVGITVLGFLVFGRSWWGPLLVIGALVLLTLLLAPEAYVALGLAFALLLLAALAATIAVRFHPAAPAPSAAAGSG